MTTNDTTLSPFEQSKINFRLLVLEVAWFGLALPATSQFLAVYAIRLDASPALLGWLAALPAITALITSSAAQRWRNRFPTMLDALFLPALGFRFAFLLPALTPFFPEAWQPIWLVAAVVLPAIPQGIASVLFLVMMRESVSNDQLTALMGRRSMSFNITVAAGTLSFGFWLGQAVFPANYQIMFVAAFVVSLVSLQNVMRVRILSTTPVYLPDQPAARPWKMPGLRRAAVFSAVTHLTFFVIVPIVPLRLVDELGADEGFMSIFAMSGTAAGAIVARYTHQVVARMGSRATMATGMIGSGVAGVILAVMDTRDLALAAGVIGGACWTLAAISQFTYFSENAPPDGLTRYMTVYNQVIMLAVFVGPLIGSQLASTSLSLGAVILFGAGLRFLAGVIVSADGIGDVRRARRRAVAA